MINLVFVFLITAVTRICAVFALGWHIRPDLWEYHDIALNILSAKGYMYHHLNTDYLFYMSPFYSYWSALMYFLINKNYLIIELAQVLIAGISVIFLMKIAKKIFNIRTAFVCGLLYALHPGLIIYTIKMHEFIFVSALIIFISYLVLNGKNAFIDGIMIGLAFYVRVVFIFFIPAFFIYTAMKAGFKIALTHTAIAALLAFIIIVPWGYRGCRAYNRFVLRTDSAQAFWQANNPLASGSSLTKENKPVFDTLPEEFKNKVFSLNEIGQYDFFRKEAADYIKANPLQFVKNTAKKFYYFWWFSPQAGLQYPSQWLFIYRVFYCFLAMFFAAGAYFIIKNRRRIDLAGVLFLLTFVLLISITHSFVYVEVRHRWMIEPLLMLGSAYGIVSLFLKERPNVKE